MSEVRPDPSDIDLVTRARDGDGAAFGVLVRRHERRVYNLAYRMMGRTEDARDVAQDAFLSCFRHLGSFRGDAAFTTWLHRITLNACYDALRRRPPDPVPLEGLDPSPGRDHADQAAASVDVHRALALVPVEFRAALILHDLQGVPYEDVAAALGVPLGTVKSRLHRGRLALARLLAGEGTEADPVGLPHDSAGAAEAPGEPPGGSGASKPSTPNPGTSTTSGRATP